MKRNVILLLLVLTILPLTNAYQFCDNQTSSSQLKIISMNDITQDSTDWIWTQSQNIDIKLELENRNFTTRNFKLELFFLDEADSIKKITETNLAKTTELEKDKPETLNLSFQLDESSQGGYSLYAKLFDPNNESICTSSEETAITIKEAEKIIVIKNIEGPENISQESYGIYIVEVANYGSSTEEKVSVIAYNANLGIRETKEISNLKADETESVTFTLNIPENATAQKEKFLFGTEYDYNEKTGYYYQSSDKEKAFFIQINKVGGSRPQENETQNIPTQIAQTPTQPTQSQTAPQQTNKNSNPYFWIIAIIVFSITVIVIATALILYLKSKKGTSAPTTGPESSEKVKAYVEKIRNS